jgi:hypothetical protein
MHGLNGQDAVPLSSTLGNFVSQIVIRSTGYVQIAFDNMPAVNYINGLCVVSEHHGSTTGAHTQSSRVNDNGTQVTMLNAADSSDATVSYASSPFNVSPNTSAAWTKARVDALLFEWGLSTDVIGNPILDGVCLEVDYAPAGGYPYSRMYSRV